MVTITQHALRVYSSLAALRGNNGDVLDALIPFFEPILRVVNGKIFDPKVFAFGVRKMYSWQFTKEIAEQFIPRLAALGIRRKIVNNNGESAYIVEYTDQAAVDDTDDIKRVFEEIIDEFAKFPVIITDLLNYVKNRDELADILIRFLVSSNVFGKLNGTVDAGDDAGSLMANLPEGGRPLTEYDKYITARFVGHLVETRPDFVPYLSRLASIGLLTEVVDDFVRPISQAAKVDLSIIIDAPLALDYLGLSGNDIQADIRAVLDALKAIGANLFVFPVTTSEMSRNLRAMLSKPVTQRHGYTHDAMIRRQVMPDYVNTVAGDPEASLENVGILLKDTNLEKFPNQEKYFTREMYQDFLSKIQWGADIKPREHDATCLALLMRLREGKHARDVFKCRYVFVTRNVTFARQARDYCVRGQLVNENHEGPVIHQRELATIAWLRTGLGEAQTIPRKHLIASCNRILQVRPEVSDAVAAKLKEFTPEKLEQFQALLLDQRSVRKLADATLNDEKVVTSENAQQLLDLMREATAAELQSKYEADMEAARKRHEKSQRTAKAKHIDELADREDQVRILSERLEAKSLETKRIQQSNDAAVSVMIAHVNRNTWILRMIITVTMIFMGGAFVLNEYVSFLPENGIAWKAVLAICGVVGVYEWIADKLEFPQYGLRNILRVISRFGLRREIKRRGLTWVREADFSITDGQLEREPLTIDHQTDEIPPRVISKVDP